MSKEHRIFCIEKRKVTVFDGAKFRIYRRLSASTRERLRTLPNVDRWNSVHSHAVYMVPGVKKP